MPDLVLYDGVCGLCNRLNQFILKRDSRDRFRFASIQSALGGEVLARHGREPTDVTTVYVVEGFGTSGEHLLSKARAVLFVIRCLGGIWGLARIFELLPSTFLDTAYDFVARRRYRWFGRSETCMVPRLEHRSKFLDDDGTQATSGSEHAW